MDQLHEPVKVSPASENALEPRLHETFNPDYNLLWVHVNTLIQIPIQVL